LKHQHSNRFDTEPLGDKYLAIQIVDSSQNPSSSLKQGLFSERVAHHTAKRTLKRLIMEAEIEGLNL